MPNTVAIVQARMSSSRLPGKVLSAVGNQTMLDRVVQRLGQAQTLDQVVVATSDLPQDHTIVTHCRAKNLECVTGSNHDVLSRFILAAKRFDADFIVRITADCPLLDPEVVDRVVDALKSPAVPDYVCNFYPRRTFPRGLDVEALRREVLEQVDSVARDPRHREHVTLFIYENPHRYRIESIRSDIDRSDLRWTVDEHADLHLIRAIYAAFQGQPGSWQDILRAYEQNPQWRHVNATVAQKAA